MHKWLSSCAASRALAAAAVCGVILAGCSGDSSGSGSGSAPSVPIGLAQFSDIPIPTGASLDPERSLVLGAADNWLGRAVMATSYSPASLFEFYTNEMRRFGWTEVTTVRGEPSVLTFSRANRVATVQIASRTLRGALVSVTMSPRGQDGATGSFAPGVGSGGMSAPSPGAVQITPLR
jgi:hypothetical protein